MGEGENEDFSYCFENGSELIIKVLPKYGYQFDAAAFCNIDGNVIETEPMENMAVYSSTVPNNNVHLAEMYMPVEDRFYGENLEGIDEGTFALAEDENTENIHGNLVMSVTNSDASSEDFLSELGEGNHELLALLDISINPEITMGSVNDTWVDKNITEFEKEITIMMKLSEDATAKVQDIEELNIVKELGY